MITLNRVWPEMQRSLKAAVTAFEQGGCPLHPASDLALFGNGMSFAIIAIPEQRDRPTDAHPVENSKANAVPELAMALVP